MKIQMLPDNTYLAGPSKQPNLLVFHAGSGRKPKVEIILNERISTVNSDSKHLHLLVSFVQQLTNNPLKLFLLGFSVLHMN